VDKAGEKRLTMLSKALGKAGIDFRPESFKWSVVQALLSRGDRRITPLLLRVREYGDSAGSFRRAFKVCQIPLLAIISPCNLLLSRIPSDYLAFA
jgi:hypothetical protein